MPEGTYVSAFAAVRDKPKVDFGDTLGSALQWRKKSANGLESP